MFPSEEIGAVFPFEEDRLAPGPTLVAGKQNFGWLVCHPTTLWVLADRTHRVLQDKAFFGVVPAKKYVLNGYLLKIGLLSAFAEKWRIYPRFEFFFLSMNESISSVFSTRRET